MLDPDNDDYVMKTFASLRLAGDHAAAKSTSGALVELANLRWFAEVVRVTR